MPVWRFGGEKCHKDLVFEQDAEQTYGRGLHVQACERGSGQDMESFLSYHPKFCFETRSDA